MTASASPAPDAAAPAPAPAKREAPPILTGSGQVLASLEKLGITDVFGIPGGAIMPFYDELMASTAIRHILVRHEQGGGHAAEGYAAASGRVGVCIATSGPGATNLVTAIADAHMTPCRSSPSRARCSRPRWGPTRSRRSTSRASRCPSRSTRSS